MIEEIGRVGAVQKKRRIERGKVVARERGREGQGGGEGRGEGRARRTEGSEKGGREGERNTGSEVFFGAWQSSA